MSNTIIQLIEKTGISPQNYMYWASKDECDSWFLGKSKTTLEKYAYVRGDSVSKHGYNVGCVHVDLPHSEVLNCDYLSYKNEIYENRWFHCQIVAHEYVNEKSTRLHFVIDYVASYWDTIKLKKCLVERTHVTDDWKSKGTVTASKYLLSEPVGVEIRHRPELLKKDPFKYTNDQLNINYSVYSLITTVDENGAFSDPKINYQSGTPIGGFLYVGTNEYMEELLKKYVTFSNQLIVKQESILSYVSSIYVAPFIVADNKTAVIPPVKLIDTFEGVIDYSKVGTIRHAKVLDYFRLRIVGNTADVIMSPAEYGSEVRVDVQATGGPSGCITMMFNDKEDKYNGVSCSTMSWPYVPFAGSMPKVNYGINDDYKSPFNTEAVKKQMGNSAGDAAINFQSLWMK